MANTNYKNDNSLYPSYSHNYQPHLGVHKSENLQNMRSVPATSPTHNVRRDTVNLWSVEVKFFLFVAL